MHLTNHNLDVVDLNLTNVINSSFLPPSKSQSTSVSNSRIYNWSLPYKRNERLPLLWVVFKSLQIEPTKNKIEKRGHHSRNRSMQEPGLQTQLVLSSLLMVVVGPSAEEKTGVQCESHCRQWPARQCIACPLQGLSKVVRGRNVLKHTTCMHKKKCSWIKKLMQ